MFIFHQEACGFFFFKFATAGIIIGLCATIEARKQKWRMLIFSTERKDKTSVVMIVFRLG